MRLLLIMMLLQHLAHSAAATCQQPPAACTFPFIYKGNNYTECVTEESAPSWCATQVNGTGHYTEQSVQCLNLCEKNITGGFRQKDRGPNGTQNPDVWSGREAIGVVLPGMGASTDISPRMETSTDVWSRMTADNDTSDNVTNQPQGSSNFPGDTGSGRSPLTHLSSMAGGEKKVACSPNDSQTPDCEPRKNMKWPPIKGKTTQTVLHSLFELGQKLPKTNVLKTKGGGSRDHSHVRAVKVRHYHASVRGLSSAETHNQLDHGICCPASAENSTVGFVSGSITASKTLPNVTDATNLDRVQSGNGTTPAEDSTGSGDDNDGDVKDDLHPLPSCLEYLWYLLGICVLAVISVIALILCLYLLVKERNKTKVRAIRIVNRPESHSV